MDDKARIKLWEEYSKKPTAELREKIILEYSQLVKVVAGRLQMYLGNNVEYDDLVGYGIFGLIDAIDKFDAKKEIKFETYASFRIRGAILDQIRKMDWIPRTVRQRQRKITDAIKEIESRTGRNATDEEIIEMIGISSDEYDEWQAQMNVTNILSLDEFVEAGSDTGIGDSVGSGKVERPEEAIEKEEIKKMLIESLNLLTEKERTVVMFYYYEDLTLKEISNILEVSESRVSQLHSKALNKMKKIMGPYMNAVLQPE